MGELKATVSKYVNDNFDEAVAYVDANIGVLPTKARRQWVEHRALGGITAKEVIIMVIAIYILAALLPSAISSLNQANQTGWTSTQIALYGVISIVIIAIIIYKFAE